MEEEDREDENPRSRKRVKDHDFEDDDEARAYVEALTLGNPQLPVNVWELILSNNPQLSINDIQRMCAVNWRFRQMCEDGHIWNRIFIRQFGQEAFDKARAEMPEGLPEDPLARLMTERFIRDRNFTHGYADAPGFAWTMSDKQGMVLLFEAGRLSITQELLRRNERSFTLTITFPSSRAVRMDGYEFARHLAKLAGLERELVTFSRARGSDDSVMFQWRSAWNDRAPKFDALQRWIVYWAFLDRFYPDIDPEDEALLQTGALVCAACGAPSPPRQCGACQKARYCAEDCQRAHWYAEHRDACVWSGK